MEQTGREKKNNVKNGCSCIFQLSIIGKHYISTGKLQYTKAHFFFVQDHMDSTESPFPFSLLHKIYPSPLLF